MKKTTSPLQTVPGIGPAVAAKLNWLGIMEPQELCGQDPQELYDRYQDLVGHPVDRCLLYVFRCAVYYCETEKPDPELLKWWNWKDN